jgi:trafficking protein particle complex subunit 2
VKFVAVVDMRGRAVGDGAGAGAGAGKGGPGVGLREGEMKLVSLRFLSTSLSQKQEWC